MVVVIAVFILICLIGGGLYAYRRAYRRIRNDSIAAAESTVNQKLESIWPHPWVGVLVAYKADPETVLGEIVHVDGAGRARIDRGRGKYIRRSLSRLKPLYLSTKEH